MSSGHSRGGPLTTDRPTAENPCEKFTYDGMPRLGQPQARRALQPLPTVKADVVRFTGRLLFVECPYCGRHHAHGAPCATCGVAEYRTSHCRGGRSYRVVVPLERRRTVEAGGAA